MKFDKDIVIGVAICIAVLVGWQFYSSYQAKNAPPAPVAVVTPGPVGSSAPSIPAAVPAEETLLLASKIPALPNRELKNDQLILSFSPTAGILDAVELRNYYKAGRNEPIVIRNQSSGTETVRHPGALGVFDLTGWTVQEVVDNKLSEDSYQLTRRIASAAGQEFLLIQTWTLKGNFLIEYQVTFSNPASQTLVLRDVVIDGGDLSDWHELSGDTVRSEKHNVDFMTADGKYDNVEVGDDEFGTVVGRSARWVAVTNKYLTCFLLSKEPFSIYAASQRMPGGTDNKGYNVGIIGARYAQIDLPPGGSRTFDFNYFVGPKISDELESIDSTALKVMHLAWGPLDWLSQLLLKLLIWLHGWVGSYGWSIILLTLIVRLLFWPVTLKANRSMKRMQTVQPKIQELRAKYKSEPQVMNAKMMELYREEKVNPFGGCLPILMQIPVFIALYQTLESAVQLRQEPFWWIKDLAAPDTVATLFGIGIHPLALAMTGLMVVQQMMTPMAMDGMQKRMMYLMPVVMLFVLYNLPSGLTLYWTVSSLFSIAQMLWQRKWDKGPAVKKEAAAGAK